MSELALTERESRRLKALEGVISKSAGDMYDAMRSIHDEKLYRADFATWEEYCQSRWGMSRRHADRLIEHGRILALLADDPKTGPIGPVSEAVSREISTISDSEKVEVVSEVAEESRASNNGSASVTAAAVRRKVKEHQREPGDESEPTGAAPVNGKPIKATADLVESFIDDAGNEVPESLFPVWRERDNYFRICDDLKSLSGQIRELGKTPAGKGCSAIAREVDESGKALALLMPSVVSGKSWKSLGEAK